MKVAIVSDTHFGFQWDSERGTDSFDNAREAFKRTRDADLVILPGDIYDHKVPKQEVLGDSIDCFNEYKTGECNLRITDDSDVTYEFTGTPVVAIHGTHERRSKGFTNPIELLDKMGYLLHLHNERVVFEHNETGEKVAIHGMSGVPERYAPGVLEKFDPQPVPDAYNIFVFHQSVENFVFTSNEHHVLKLEDFPTGFDLLVDGHIHWHDLSNVGSEKPLILPGSTISTQMRKIEAEKPKGFVTVDTDTKDVSFNELDSCRQLFYKEISVDGMSGSDIMSTVAQQMKDIQDSSFEKKPLVRIVLQGNTDATVKLSDIRKQYAEDCILSISKRFNTSSKRITPARFQENTKSIGEMGKDMLRSKLDNDSLQVENLFEMLADERLEDALGFVEEIELAEEDKKDDSTATSDIPVTDSEHEDTVSDMSDLNADPEPSDVDDDTPTQPESVDDADSMRRLTDFQRK